MQFNRRVSTSAIGSAIAKLSRLSNSRRGKYILASLAAVAVLSATGVAGATSPSATT